MSILKRKIIFITIILYSSFSREMKLKENKIKGIAEDNGDFIDQFLPLDAIYDKLDTQKYYRNIYLSFISVVTILLALLIILICIWMMIEINIGGYLNFIDIEMDNYDK
eukprot:GAHX01003550.1.p1 GENE.GAHX01003550.1~~GAHX01003550.1.p1  ORF type:complete len:109 (+),score=10.54 GAHX01003550.1:65-391(+)